MAQPINPSSSNFNRPNGTLRWAQSIKRALNQGVLFANPVGQNSQKVYNKFQSDNGNGTMVRIGATGSGEDYEWPAANSGVVIYHNLGRQPIGFIVHDIDGDARVYRTVAPDDQQITLACTDNTKNATVYIS